MQSLIDSLIRDAGHDPAQWPFTQLYYLLGMFLAAVPLMGFAAVFSGLLSWWERRVAARMQSRVGPNRVGPGGALQWLADALKLIVKEDLIPGDSDHLLFRMAPYFVICGLILTFVCLPWGVSLVPADMNVGLFYVISVTALTVVGIIMSGWSSNSKWALFGGMRAAAQVVSYEIPAGMAILVPVMMSGSLSLQDIIKAQGAMPWDWFLFANPMAFVAFFVFVTAALAEGNRTPFDLPEAESELVAGYHSEYSGMRFSYFFLVEWANVWVMSAMAVTLFLGGWQVPFKPYQEILAAHGWAALFWQGLSMAIFVVKTLIAVNVVVWLRWTLPRIRVDQMMDLCWKYLVPLMLVSVTLLALDEWLVGEALAKGTLTPRVIQMGHIGFFLVAGLLPLVAFFRQVFKNIRLVNGTVDLFGNS